MKAKLKFSMAKLAQIKQPTISSMISGYSSRIDDFGSYKDQNGWNGFIPTTDFLMKWQIANLKASYETKTAWIRSLRGDILSGDHTFKVAKVPCSNYERVFEAMFSVMNEKGQIIGYWMTCSKSLREIRPELEKVNCNYRKLTSTFILIIN